MGLGEIFPSTSPRDCVIGTVGHGETPRTTPGGTLRAADGWHSVTPWYQVVSLARDS